MSIFGDQRGELRSPGKKQGKGPGILGIKMILCCDCHVK